ncbi:shikimate dehydrogenase [Alicyclobacillus macrosporangiidus]|uniref:Shikimate dehydrogenase (NADP(+)) n=1 Tax=Alicyclobacillus macrosporangiidus TaxID=392015 RepID=A0A1I7K9A5_9BACL|nr:shikimate dehydrogenase [Alicyclobacillus macrosporangiidus]SFU94036.1 shikimate dehydrogenase [Alicyclobacillus macrosporangiidus]
MRLYGVLGWPVGHSASPAMMNAAFRAAGQAAVYMSFEVAPTHIAAAVEGLRALGAGGFNVTIPHKQAVFSLLDEVTDTARMAGAVNTVRVDPGGRLWGHNTDVDGWWESVRPHLEGIPERVAVLGAGGAARAVLTALALRAPGTRVAVAARRLERAEALAVQFGDWLRVQVFPWADRHACVAQADLVAQTTPIGMWPETDAAPVEDGRCFRAGQVVQDAVYRPLRTRFLEEAAARGATAVDGLSMLVEQGALAYERWFEAPAPRAVMRAAAEEAVRHGPQGDAARA